MSGNTPKVVILCGGQGTRLREETEYKPKPLVEIGGKPILWHIMKHYAHYGLNDFILCLGYKGEQIKEYFLNYKFFVSDFSMDLRTGEKSYLVNNADLEDWQINFIYTGLETMTGSRIKKVLPYIKTDYFFATYGDGVSDVNLNDLKEFYLKSGKIAVLTGVHPWSKYGQIRINDENSVTHFIEKPRLTDFINGGYFVFNRKIFDYLPEGDNCILEREPFDNLASDGQIGMFKHKGFWHCMDTYKDYEDLNNLWQPGKRPWEIWTHKK